MTLQSVQNHLKVINYDLEKSLKVLIFTLPQSLGTLLNKSIQTLCETITQIPYQAELKIPNHFHINWYSTQRSLKQRFRILISPVMS